MNLIAIGFAGLLALAVLGLLLSFYTGFRPNWAASGSRQHAAEAKRKDVIFKG